MTKTNSKNVTNYRYHAFISYRHADNKTIGRQWATWLHHSLETYEIPKDLVGKINDRGESIPERIYPVFRDEEELPAHADLAHTITQALEQTNILVVLCSPRAVASTYVANEIDYFKKLTRSDRIIAAIIDGEPNASWDKGKHSLGFNIADECFPLPLQFQYDDFGNNTLKHCEPVAADFRINHEGKMIEGWTTPAAYRDFLSHSTSFSSKEIEQMVVSYQKQSQLMLLKIISSILGVSLSDLTQRDKQYQLDLARKKTRQLQRWLAIVSVLVILTLIMSVFAYVQREKVVKELNTANTLLSKIEDNAFFLKYELSDLMSNYFPDVVHESIDAKIVGILKPLSIIENEKLLRDMAVYINNAELILENHKKGVGNNDLSLAKDCINKAIIILLEVRKANSQSLFISRRLSALYIELGDINRLISKTQEAIYSYGLSISLSNVILRDGGSNSDVNILLAKGYLKSAYAYLDMNDLNEARFFFRRSFNILNDYLSLNPDKIPYLYLLNEGQYALAYAELLSSQSKSARSDFELSVEYASRLLKIESNNRDYRHQYMLACFGLYRTYEDKESKLAKKILLSGYEILQQDEMYQSIHTYQGAQDIVYFFEEVIPDEGVRSVDVIKESYLLLLGYKPNDKEYMKKYLFYLNLEMKNNIKSKGFSKSYRAAEIGLKNINVDFYSINSVNKRIPLTKEVYDLYNSWAWSKIHTRSFESVINIIENIFASDINSRNSDHYILLNENLAHAYLLLGKYEMAKGIYAKYKGYKFSDGRTWNEIILNDFNKLKDDGILHPDFSHIAEDVFDVKFISN